MTAGRHSCETFKTDPYILPVPHSAYSLFMEYTLGQKKYRSFLDVNDPVAPSQMAGMTAVDMNKYQFDPDQRKARPAVFHGGGTITDDRTYLERVALTMEFLERNAPV